MTASLIESPGSFYVVGGTMRHDAPSYVERNADKELFSALVHGEFCHVLTARQMGKSSLMLRTASALRNSGIGVAALDLTAIGQNLTAEQWYGGLMIQMGDRLDLEGGLLEFWTSQSMLGPMQRWVNAIRKVVLPRSVGPLVIFIDEIDAVRSLNFSTDEFFAGIRECYNLRNEDKEIQRLTFCLLGVATPSDLIRDTRTTPFNVGQRIELNDFTPAEGLSLADGLRRSRARSQVILKRIFYWTGGHPYLTQRICQAVAEDYAIGNAGDVDQLIEDLFFSKRAREYDDNLIFVRERLLRSGADLTALLTLYSKIYRGKAVPDDDANPLVSILRLSGVTHVERGLLRVRNRIYERVFNSTWAASNLPDFEVKRQREAYRRGVLRTATVGTIIVALVAGLALIAIWQRNKALEQASVNRRLLYMAQMKLANQEWENANISRVEELVEATRPLPGDEDLRGFEWYLFWNYSRKELFRLKELAPITNVKLLPDNNTLAIGEAPHAMVQLKREYRIKLHDLQARRDLFSFTVPAGKNFDVVAFSSDFQCVATDSPDKTVVLWDIKSGHRIRELKPGHSRAVRVVAFAPGKPCLASADLGGVLKIWDIATEEVKLTRNVGHPILGLAFSPDGRLLAIATESRAVLLLELDTGRFLRPFSIEEGTLSQTVFSPDGGRLSATTLDGRLYLFDVATRRVIWQATAHTSEIPSIAFSPNGTTLATGSVDRTVKLWEVTSGKKLREIRGHGSWVNSVSWSSDGRLLTTGALDGAVKIWEPFAKAMPVLPDQPVRSCLATALSSDDELLALGTAADSHVKLWNLSNGKELLNLEDREKEILCAAFSKDAKTIATGGTQRIVKIREVATGKLINTLAGSTYTVLSLDFSPDGKMIISGDENGNLMLWDVYSGRSLGSLNSGNSYYRAVFSTDGKLIASADQDGSIRLWDIFSLSILKTFAGHTSAVRSIAFSPDGRLIATGADDNTIRLWDIAAGQELRQRQSDSILRLAFTPAGDRLVSGSLDGTVILWNVADMLEVITWSGHRSDVTSVTFSRNGSILAVSSADGTVEVWQAADIARAGSQSR